MQLHHSIANETLTAFSTSHPSVASASVFAVEVNTARTVAKLLLHPSHITGCNHCASVGSELAQDSLPFALRLPREIEFMGRCDASVQLPLIIIYAHLVSAEFGEWLKKTVDEMEQCTRRFALRFWIPADENVEGREDGPVLQGYATHVALKSTEYKVVDDRVFSTRLFPDCPYGFAKCEQTRAGRLEDDFAWREVRKDDETPLTYSGAKMMKFIRDNSKGDLGKALGVLRMVAEDGPSLLRSERFLGFKTPSGDETKAMLREVRQFREKVGDSDYLFINGHALDLYSVSQNIGQLFRCLSVATVAAMNRDVIRSKLGTTTGHELNTEDVTAVKNSLRVDLGFGKKVQSSLVWFNDIYNDNRYKTWPLLNMSNVNDVTKFQSMIEKRGKLGKRPGTEHLQLAKVKSHHLSLVVVLDPGDAQQFAYTSIPQMIVRSDLPIHIGLILVPNGRVSSLVAASFYYFLRMKGRKTCASFLQMVQQVLQYIGGGFQQVPLSEQIVELAFQQIALKLDGPYATAADVLERDEEIKVVLHEAQSFARERELFSRANDLEQMTNDEDLMRFSLLGILNGIVLKDISSDVIPVALAEQARIAKFLEPNSVKTEQNGEEWEAASDFEQWVARDTRLIVVEGLSREMKKGDQRLSRFKSDDDERRLSGTTLFHLREEMKSILYFGSKAGGNDTSHCVTVWMAGTEPEDESFKEMTALIQELAISEFSSRTKARFAVLEPGTMLHSSVVEIASSETSSQTLYLAINGRILPASEVKCIDDLKVEIATEFERALLLSRSPGDIHIIEGSLAEDTKKACKSDILGGTARGLHVSYSEMLKAASESNISMFSFRNSDKDSHETPFVEVYAVVSPMEKNAFIPSAVLTALHEAYSFGHFAMTVLMVPTATEVEDQVEHPSVFSKFVMETKPRFEDHFQMRISSSGVFSRLPQQKVLTVSVEPPRAWFVASYATNYDMDNVVLMNLPEEVENLHVEYELRNLIVEGSCVDEEENPPQGLKLILENDAGISVDTLVMSNLGYFQLKAPTPGRWILRLATGASSEVFSLKVMEMYTGFVKTMYKADSTGRVPILVESLSGAGGILLRVERNPGMAGKSVLDPDVTPKPTPHGTITNRLREKITSFYKRKAEESLGKSIPPSHSDVKKIHIFSVASGHLYERFLKIMMSSVTKHSSRPVKFWLLENYLSPSFKKMLPLFAKKLGCEVGTVTYKWPGWLRSQTEKQRIIWAYKILFLDVLFPLDVGRIVFVDSDQVIRGDLAELMDIDLQGAPYGYVPFCDSRKEVEGYRFWKQGFWKDTLQGAKYRISALYVVDLNRFRETAAGDTLRLIYQSLSADPNSLSNLDQDLPNYASVSPMGGNAVPIFDLPAEWLWCESWCDDESKKTAKAIDLCNNPMTKEPKLQSAKRIISEWVDYDDFASHLTDEIYQQLASNDSNGERDDVQNTTTCRPEENCEPPTDFDDSEKIEL